ncbi:hypothetical protein MKleb_5684 (plasmid) [Klebsiella sp. PL-2018]|nr:hypothetical protein MKleb_5684 [Klebsiella sp. PL-2018]
MSISPLLRWPNSVCHYTLPEISSMTELKVAVAARQRSNATGPQAVLGQNYRKVRTTPGWHSPGDNRKPHHCWRGLWG